MNPDLTASAADLNATTAEPLTAPPAAVARPLATRSEA
jgi:hypothetical protein